MCVCTGWQESICVCTGSWDFLIHFFCFGFFFFNGKYSIKSERRMKRTHNKTWFQERKQKIQFVGPCFASICSLWYNIRTLMFQRESARWKVQVPLTLRVIYQGLVISHVLQVPLARFLIWKVQVSLESFPKVSDFSCPPSTLGEVPNYWLVCPFIRCCLILWGLLPFTIVWSIWKDDLSMQQENYALQGDRNPTPPIGNQNHLCRGEPIHFLNFPQGKCVKPNNGTVVYTKDSNNFPLYRGILIAQMHP